MEKITHCHHNGKDGFKFKDGDKCYTYNKNLKSRRKAYELASKEMIKHEHSKQ